MPQLAVDFLLLAVDCLSQNSSIQTPQELQAQLEALTLKDSTEMFVGEIEYTSTSYRFCGDRCSPRRYEFAELTKDLGYEPSNNPFDITLDGQRVRVLQPANGNQKMTWALETLFRAQGEGVAKIVGFARVSASQAEEQDRLTGEMAEPILTEDWAVLADICDMKTFPDYLSAQIPSRESFVSALKLLQTTDRHSGPTHGNRASGESARVRSSCCLCRRIWDDSNLLFVS